MRVINRGPSAMSVGGANPRPNPPFLPSPIHEDEDDDMDMDDEDPLNRGFGSGFVMSDDSSDNSIPLNFNNFIDREAQESDNEAILIDSEDEETENQDRYENSFINDESMANDSSFARAGLLDESEIVVPQRRSGVLATPHVFAFGNGRLSVQINGNRESLSSLRGKKLNLF